MRWLHLAALIACMPAAAEALSCRPHSVEAAFLEAQADDAPFVIVRGRLEFDARKLPKVDYNNQRATPDVTLIPAKLSGNALSNDGFATPYSKDVTLSVACYGPWCASAPHDSGVLAFVEKTPKGDVISTNPCGGYLFGTPTVKMIRAVKRCFAGKTCTPVR